MGRFFSSLFLLVFLNLLIKPIWIFGIDREVQNQVGTSLYGTYFALFNLSYIFNFLLDLGLSNYYNQRLASGKAKLSTSFAPVSSLKILLGLAYAFLLIVIAWISEIRDVKLLLLLGLSQFLFSLLIFFRASITALQLFKTDAFLSVLDKILLILFAGILLYFPAVAGEISLHKFALLQVGTVFISILISFWVIARKHQIIFFTWKPDLKILFSSLPFALTIFVMSAHNRQDAFLLERLHPDGAYESGVYAGAYRLLDACNMIGYLVASFLLPFLAKNLGNKLLIRKTVSLSFGILLSAAFVINVATFFYGPQIHDLLYKDHNEYAGKILVCTMLALPGYYLVQVFGTWLTASGSIRLLLKIAVVSWLLNLTLNLLFIPEYGAIAPATIAVITQTFFGTFRGWYYSKKGLRLVPGI